MKLIIGLGNPGKLYEKTRHNIGFSLLDVIAKDKGFSFNNEKFNAKYVEINIDGERVILTFGGESSFTLVEETVSREEEFTVIPTYGEPHLINGTIGALTDNSLNWTSENIEYYLVSDVMSSDELLNIANSINVKAVSSMK